MAKYFILRIKNLTLKIQSMFTSFNYYGFKNILKLSKEEAFKFCTLFKLAKFNRLMPV